jgi:opacity protein-like surface antigen
VVFTAGTVSAQPDYTRQGPYAVVAGTYANDDFHNRFGGEHDGSLGFNLRAGYRFLPRLAVELEFERLSEFEGDGGNPLNLKAWNTSVNGKTFLGTGRAQGYFIGGIGAIHVESTGTDDDLEETEFGAKAGAGVEFHLNEHIALAAEARYTFATDKLDDFKYTSVSWGVTLRP